MDKSETMPGNINKLAPTSNPGITHCAIVVGTSNTNTTNLPSQTDLIMKLPSTGPVKNATDANTCLEQRSLIATDGQA